MKEDDVDDRPSAVIKLSQTRKYAQLPSHFALQNFTKF